LPLSRISWPRTCGYRRVSIPDALEGLPGDTALGAVTGSVDDVKELPQCVYFPF
jgi:hypothetical protein